MIQERSKNRTGSRYGNGMDEGGRNRNRIKRIEAWKKEGRKLKSYVRSSIRVRILLALCMILVIAAATKLISNTFFYSETQITDAFAVTESGCIESRLQLTADYGTGFLTEHDKQALAAYLANILGIRMEGAAAYHEDEVCQMYTYEKEAKQAKTVLKVITLQEDVARTYLYVDLIIYEDTGYQVMSYGDMLLEGFQELKVEQVETTLQFTGAYDGKLALSEWNRLANQILEELSGKIIYENRDPELYTIYAYSSQLPEYLSVDGKKINIQVALRYEEDNDRTVLYLASPILRGDW